LHSRTECSIPNIFSFLEQKILKKQDPKLINLNQIQTASHWMV